MTTLKLAKPVQKVNVAVSLEMANLRETHTFLNRFVWTTEIAYRAFLSSPEVKEKSSHLAVNALSHLMAEAWVPNNQGQIKFNDTVETVVKMMGQNLPYIFRTVIILFSTAFEDYLKSRLKTQLHEKRDSYSTKRRTGNDWVPYFYVLPSLMPDGTKCPIGADALLCADICRKIRNLIVHNPTASLPIGGNDPIVKRWKYDFSRNRFYKKASEKNITDALDHVIDNAAKEYYRAQDEGKTLPVEFFYMLYTFTNLNNLAFEIEEAMIPHNFHPEGRVLRPQHLLHRKDLIVPSPNEVTV